jgi:uncharacterized protein YegL
MPRLLDNDMHTGAIPVLAGYQFSAIRTDRLGESEYTLVTLALDTSGSVMGFRDLLVETVKKIVDACRKSPKSANILVRVITFSHDLTEVHGFKPLAEIDPSVYDSIRCYGTTALFDACASGIGAMTEYGRTLIKQDFGVNGIAFFITDGDDNASTYTAHTVKGLAEDAVTGEVLETFRSILIGVNAASVKQYLEDFRIQGGLNEYIDAGDATPGNLAKLAAFVSRSVSSSASGVVAPVTF